MAGEQSFRVLHHFQSTALCYSLTVNRLYNILCYVQGVVCWIVIASREDLHLQWFGHQHALSRGIEVDWIQDKDWLLFKSVGPSATTSSETECYKGVRKREEGDINSFYFIQSSQPSWFGLYSIILAFSIWIQALWVSIIVKTKAENTAVHASWPGRKPCWQWLRMPWPWPSFASPMSGYLGSYLAITGSVINSDYSATAGKKSYLYLNPYKTTYNSQWGILSTLNIYTWTQNFLFDGNPI